MKALGFCIGFACLASQLSFGQDFKVSAEIRPRLEVRNGYGQLAKPLSDPAVFVSQRSRLNFDFKQDSLTVKFSMQNARVWGDVSTLSTADKNGVAMHEAWAKYQFHKNVGIKVGRQEISYDNQRIFGVVDWGQQARSHDAALLLIDLKKSARIELGVAYNANQESLFKQNYGVNQYKTLQYAWANFPLKTSSSLSFLALNNGLPYLNVNATEKIAFSQTLGGFFKSKKEKFSMDIAAYYQTGWLANNASVHRQYQSAINAAVNLNYQVHPNFNIGAGAEYLSGNNPTSTSNHNTAFNPYYGTNHKYNGAMDLFYVGNHLNSVGLIDLYLALKYVKNKISVELNPHYFLVAERIPGHAVELGTELDLTLGYKVSKSFSISGGYSHMFQTNTLVYLSGGPVNNINNWGWMMLTFKPVFYSSIK